MSETRPLIVLLCLDYYELVRNVHAHLLSALEARAETCFAQTKPEALRYLTSTSRPHTVIVCDAAESHPGFVDVLHHLVQYVQSGGTAVFAGAFSSFVRFWSLEAMFEFAWRLPWRLGPYHRTDYALNSRIKGLNVKELPKKYSMKAVTLAGITPKAALYAEPRYLRKLSRGKDSPTAETPLEAAVAFTKIEKGRLGTGVVSLVVLNAPYSVLITSLEKAPFMDEQYEQLYRATRRNATLLEVQNERAAMEALSATLPPTSVLVSDGTITHSKYSRLLTQLVEFARSGGRVVLGVHFSSTISPADGKPFFRKWGLDWDYGEYHRTTFQLNPGGVPPPLNEQALFPSMSAKAVHLRNVPVEDAVYLPESEAHVQSPVFAATPITGSRAQQTPGAFARVGEGYLGYIGDVNAEHESIRLTIEMVGVSIKPGDLGPKTVITGVSFCRGGNREVTTSVEEEIPLPTRRGQPRQIVQPHARESEVTARSEQLARTKGEKQTRGDALKDEGNSLFRREQRVDAAVKYHAAAFAAGPQPAYMKSLALLSKGHALSVPNSNSLNCTAYISSLITRACYDELFLSRLKRYNLNGLRRMSCASRRLRLLCLPILFEHSLMIYSKNADSPYLSEATRPYVKRLLCPTVYETPHEESYRTYFRLLPNLNHVRFEAMPDGISPALMDVCFDHVTSLDIAYEARWRVASSTAQMVPYTTKNPLTRFTLASHCFRELVSRLDKINLVDEYALESRYLTRLVCDMHAAAEVLSLSMETAPLSHMVEMDAPLLSSLELVYEADAGEAELLRYMSTAYPYLAQLELHRYRASEDDRDPYIPPVHCNNEEKYDSWSEFLDNQAQEVLTIMRTCPHFEYVAFLDPRRQFCTWIEYRPEWYPGSKVDVDLLGSQRA
ncbi:hypothetical protein GY45DRAFT_1336135 [Cubamyces sp. BRFM 1775]|nr:hypothetical protein GY45DRAFT_1336135 [Cubamyces sp. BRFM 1775]